MLTYSGPHQSNKGNRFARRNRTIIRSAGDQESMGPIGVEAQSNERMRAPISPPPSRKAEAELFTVGTSTAKSFARMVSGHARRHRGGNRKEEQGPDRHVRAAPSAARCRSGARHRAARR